MRKLIIISALTLVASVSHAQTTKQPPVAPKYDKFIRLPLSDVKSFIDALNEWKRLSVYDKKATAEQKVALVTNLQEYIDDLQARLKVDSVLVEPKIKKP